MNNSHPIFPYPKNIEYAYYMDPLNELWKTDYPLIQTYNDKLNVWYEHLPFFPNIFRLDW